MSGTSVRNPRKRIRLASRQPSRDRRHAGSSAPAADDDQIGVPRGVAAAIGPGREHRVEGLAPIAERADEPDERPIEPTPQRLLRAARSTAVVAANATGSLP